MTDPVRHNWRAIILELEAAGITTYKIAVTVAGGDRNKVKRWKQGRQPGHFEGEMLLAMRREVSHETPSRRDEMYPSGQAISE